MASKMAKIEQVLLVVFLLVFPFRTTSSEESFNSVASEVERNFVKAVGFGDIAIKAVTEEDLLSNKSILEWKPPFNLSTRFPYFLSGHDFESRPIWILPIGKWRVKEVADAGEEQIEAFSKYINQLACRYLHSLETSFDIFSSGTEGNRPTDLIMLLDYENVTAAEVTSEACRVLLMDNSRKYADVIERHCSSMLIVNANFMAELFIMIFRSTFGQIQDRVEVFGTNKEKWIPEITERLPGDQLPEAYGGREGFKPLQVFG